MAFQFVQITSLDDVHFDDVFLSSFPDIDSNYVWPSHIEGPTAKLVHYRNQLQRAIDESDNGLKNDGEPFLMYKVYDDRPEGIDYLLAAGYIENGDCFRAHWYLTKPFDTSRAWIYSPEVTLARQEFYASLGITHYRALTFKETLLYSSIQRNKNRSYTNVVEETDAPINEVPSRVFLKVQI